MSCRKPCRECPWKNNNQHSLNFRTYFEKIKKVKKLSSHKCHMISHDIWAYQSKINSRNVCVGSINFQEKKL